MKAIAAIVASSCFLFTTPAFAQALAQSRDVEAPPANANASRGMAMRAGGGASVSYARGAELAAVTPTVGIGHAWERLRLFSDASLAVSSTSTSDVVVTRLGPSVEGYAGRVFGGGGLRLDWLRASTATPKAFDALGLGFVMYGGVDVVRITPSDALYLSASLAFDVMTELRPIEIRVFGNRRDPEQVKMVGAGLTAGYRFR